VEQTSITIDARRKKHITHIHLKQPEKLAVAEHWTDKSHCIDFNSASILGTATRYMDCLVREATEI
jgi:hypothetical protein